MKNLFLQLVVFLSLMGCASLTNKVEMNYSISDFIREQERRELTLSAVEGRLQIRYQLQGQSLAGNARFVLENDRSRLEVSDPVGTIRYWFVVNQNEAAAFYEDDKLAYLSSNGGASYLKKMFSLELTAHELNGLWMGVLPKSWRIRIQPQGEMDSGDIRGKISLEDGVVDFWVSPKNGVLTQLSWATSGKKIKLIYSDFDACCSFEKNQSILGHHVVLHLPEQSDQIVLDWIELNRSTEKQNPRRFEKNLPKGTKVIQLKK